MSAGGHIAILELETEEASVVTITELAERAGFRVSLYLSPAIRERVLPALQQRDRVVHDVEGGPESGRLQRVLAELDADPPDLVVLPRFVARSQEDLDRFRELARRFRVCVGIFNYKRWLPAWPPLFVSAFPYVSPAQVRDWRRCRSMLGAFHCFFVSEIERGSRNPLKVRLREITGRQVFDLPFKLAERTATPPFDHAAPRFIIPGKIQRKRRDYLGVLRYFERPDVVTTAWTLVLLGKPDGLYGRHVLSRARRINRRAGADKVVFFDSYVSQQTFDEEMARATHILAPLNPREYEFGKDSGAIYDVFKYGKIGVFNERYFDGACGVVRDGVIRYRSQSDLYRVFGDVIAGRVDYASLKAAWPGLQDYLDVDRYVAYAGAELRAAAGAPR